MENSVNTQGDFTMNYVQDVYSANVYSQNSSEASFWAVAPDLKSHHSSYLMRAIPRLQESLYYGNRWNGRVRGWMRSRIREKIGFRKRNGGGDDRRN